MENRFPNSGRRKVATIQDVARVARVSKGTVSKYLSNTPYVAEATRQRIEAAITELDYQPSAVAQGLSQGRSHTIGVIVASLRNPFYPELITGVEDAIEQAGYTLLLATTDANPGRERRIVRSMQQRRVDGMIVAAARASDTEVERLRATGTHVVLAGRGLADATFDAVVLDNRAGAAMAVRHLLEHGHKRIAHIAGPQDIVPFRHRLEGYRDTLEEAGIGFDESLVVVAAPDASPAGDDRAGDLLDLDEPPTAVFAANDSMALDILAACQRRGLRVPSDLAVIGFDNVWIDTLIAVPLTTIDGRAFDIGRQAGALLAERIEHSSFDADGHPVDVEPKQVVLQPELVVRQSCGCTPADTGAAT
jgi:DNA-binding LacI/PurR family transcriptional regulator